jgi:ribosomal protein L40E
LLTQTHDDGDRNVSLRFLQQYQPAGFAADQAVIHTFVNYNSMVRHNCSLYIQARPDRADELLKPLLSAEDPTVRTAALETAGPIMPTDPAFVAHVSTMTSDLDPSVRHASWTTLGEWLNHPALPMLTDELRRQPPAFEIASRDSLTASISEEVRGKLGISRSIANAATLPPADSSEVSGSSSALVAIGRWAEVVTLLFLALVAAGAVRVLVIRRRAAKARSRIRQLTTVMCNRCLATIPTKSHFCRRCGLAVVGA